MAKKMKSNGVKDADTEYSPIADREASTTSYKGSGDMYNLGSKAIRSGKPKEYTGYGTDYKDANNVKISSDIINEGELSEIKRVSPERPYVETTQSPNAPKGTSYAIAGGGKKGEKLYIDTPGKKYGAKPMHAAQMRMGNMVDKSNSSELPPSQNRKPSRAAQKAIELEKKRKELEDEYQTNSQRKP